MSPSRSPELLRLLATLPAGSPLDPGLRGFLESRTGACLAHVRLHVGRQATEVARLAGARALAVNGRDIVVADAEFQPGTEEGIGLIAHEVAHAIQQRLGGSPPVARWDGAVDPGSLMHWEDEAEHLRRSLLGGMAPPRLSPCAQPLILCAPTVLTSTAKIDAVTSKVAPTVSLNLGTGSQAVANLTNGFDPNPQMVGTAFDFFGRVKVSGVTGSNVTGFDFGFIQFIRHTFLGIFYAGRSSKEGAVAVNVGPLIGKAFLVDAFRGNTVPFMVPPNNDVTGGEVISQMGDHPVISVNQKQHNFKTGMDNFLFHIVDTRDAFSIYTMRDAQGVFQHFAHLQWSLRYDVKFKWQSGAVSIAQNGSQFDVGKAVAGAPTDPEIVNLLGQLGPSMSPIANAKAQASLKTALQHPNPNRSDLDRWFNNVPADFFS